MNTFPVDAVMLLGLGSFVVSEEEKWAVWYKPEVLRKETGRGGFQGWVWGPELPTRRALHIGGWGAAGRSLA